METPQAFPVDGVLVHPHDLHDILLAGGLMPRKEGLIHQRELIILLRNIFGPIAADGFARATYPDWHRSASEDLVTNDNATQDGTAVDSVRAIHHM